MARFIDFELDSGGWVSVIPDDIRAIKEVVLANGNYEANKNSVFMPRNGSQLVTNNGAYVVRCARQKVIDMIEDFFNAQLEKFISDARPEKFMSSSVGVEKE